MKCPRCQADNIDGARFCEDCGARLELACPSRGQPVSAGKKFCRSCGAALTVEPVRFGAPESYTPKHLAEKILTSKSALVGSLAVKGRVAPVQVSHDRRSRLTHREPAPAALHPSGRGGRAWPRAVTVDLPIGHRLRKAAQRRVAT
jgi:hypothetical protein